MPYGIIYRHGGSKMSKPKNPGDFVKGRVDFSHRIPVMRDIINFLGEAGHLPTSSSESDHGDTVFQMCTFDGPDRFVMVVANYKKNRLLHLVEAGE
jgi:hypothetical protein